MDGFNFNIEGVEINLSENAQQSELRVIKLLIDSCNVSIEKDTLIAAIDRLTSVSQPDKEKMQEAAVAGDLLKIWEIMYKYVFPFQEYISNTTVVYAFLKEHLGMLF